jgi:hypothetical protein
MGEELWAEPQQGREILAYLALCSEGNGDSFLRSSVWVTTMAI